MYVVANRSPNFFALAVTKFPFETCYERDATTKQRFENMRARAIFLWVKEDAVIDVTSSIHHTGDKWDHKCVLSEFAVYSGGLRWKFPSDNFALRSSFTGDSLLLTTRGLLTEFSSRRSVRKWWTVLKRKLHWPSVILTNYIINVAVETVTHWWTRQNNRTRDSLSYDLSYDTFLWYIAVEAQQRISYELCDFQIYY